MFLGQNPAGKSKDERAFHGTRSGSVLFDWISKAGVPIDFCHFDNVSSEKTQKNKPLTLSELKRISSSVDFLRKVFSYDAVVACGKQAQLAVSLCLQGIEDEGPLVAFIEHPSGLNRNLNDPKKVTLCISTIRRIHDSLDEENL